MGQLQPELIGTLKPESLDQRDRILQKSNFEEKGHKIMHYK